jgi:hypothetical protein
MAHRRSALRILAPCLLAALGIMALAAASAQAENLVFNPKNGDKGEWLIEGKTLEERGIAKETIEGEQDPGNPTELLVPGLGLEISCAVLEVEDGLIFPKGLGLAKFLLSECEVLGSPKCVINEAQGGHLTYLYNFLVTLHEGESYAIFYPDPEGGNFTTISISKCAAALPPEPLSGSFAVLLGPEAVTQSFAEYPNQELFSTGMFFGSEPMPLDGAFNLRLSGANAGKKWGAH